MSMDSAGVQANLRSDAPSISADARFVAFQSTATNLVLGDTNGFDDVFVHDRVTNVTTRVSISSGGVQGNNHSNTSYSSCISADGRFVTFSSHATVLVGGDTNARSDIFVRDRLANTTTRVSVSSGGGQSNGHSFSPAISGDGRYVAFDSSATNLVAGDTNGAGDVFVHDRLTVTTTRVSVSTGGVQGNGGSGQPSISSDGNYVSFESVATNLVFGDSAVRDIFVRDRAANTTTRVSVDSFGGEGDLDSLDSSISGNGRYVAFQSSATNLVLGDTNGFDDVFVHDQATAVTLRVSVGNGGVQALNGESSYPSISADGRFVAFHSFAANVVANDTNGSWDVFLHHLGSSGTSRLSVGSIAVQGNDSSFQPSLSANGRFVAFQSLASNLVAGDTNGWYDIFVRDRSPLIRRGRVR